MAIRKGITLAKQLEQQKQQSIIDSAKQTIDRNAHNKSAIAKAEAARDNGYITRNQLGEFYRKNSPEIQATQRMLKYFLTQFQAECKVLEQKTRELRQSIKVNEAKHRFQHNWSGASLYAAVTRSERPEYNNLDQSNLHKSINYMDEYRCELNRLCMNLSRAIEQDVVIHQ